MIPEDITIPIWDKQLSWFSIEILKKRKDIGWDGFTKKEAEKLKEQILSNHKIVESIKDPLLQELLKDVSESMKKSYNEFDEPTYLKTQYKTKLELLQSILI